MLSQLVVISACMAVSCDAANILAFAVSNSYSHFTVMEPLFKELAARGHQVTVVSSFPQKRPLANYLDININHHLLPMQNNLTFDLVRLMGQGPVSNMAVIWGAGGTMCDNVLRTPEIQALYNSSAHYDLVLNHLFAYECFSVFAHKFDTPIVSVVTSSALPWANQRVGNPNHPAYVVNNYLDCHENMDLYQRTLNTLAWLWASLAVHPLSYSSSDTQVRRHLDPEAPPAREIIRRTSLVLVNSHFSILQSRPLVPNFVEVGGIHIKDAKPLPKSMQEFVDGAEHGVVVFSLGSLVRASSMSDSCLQALMGAFAELPQRVIFKFEEEVDNAPPNVMISKWLPQRDLLEHSNVRVLMAHGGQSSTIEAVYTGTPMVGLPLFSDQYNNIQSLVLRGAAVLLEFHSLTKDNVLEAVNTVINDPSYAKSAEQLSRQFLDRLASPLDTAVYWTEYVLRHQGAPQLRSRAADLPWHSFLLLDVAAVLLSLLAVAYFLTRSFLRWAGHFAASLFTYAHKSKCD